MNKESMEADPDDFTVLISGTTKLIPILLSPPIPAKTSSSPRAWSFETEIEKKEIDIVQLGI